MSIATPEWLSQRMGELCPGLNERTWLVVLNGTQQYRAVVTPAGGKFTCAVSQLNNGKRLDKGTIFASADTALQGGLDELKHALGWG
jgi:hypothetical protein